MCSRSLPRQGLRSSAVHGVVELLAGALEPKSPEKLRAIERIGLRLGVALEEAQRGIGVSRVYPDEAGGGRP